MLLSLLTLQGAAAEVAKIVLIIDDIGNDQQLGQRAINLPGAVHFAVLPNSLYGPALAEQADHKNKEVLVHMPMSNIGDRPLGSGALTADLDERTFKLRLNAALDAVPQSKGLNNHMGSLLTQLPQPMAWVMSQLKQRHLYFIDSRTTAQTVAEAQAHKQKLPVLRRHVFLDNNRNTSAIAVQFEKLIATAKEKGLAVGIGHPYPETLAYLEKALPVLQLRGIELTRASAVLAPQPVPACTIRELWREDCADLLKLAAAPPKN